jgi:phospholipase/carboxylesterase
MAQLIRRGGLRVHAIGPDKEGPAVLLCHGFGAPGDDLVPLADAIDLGARVRWFFPEAHLGLQGWGIPGGAWWPIDMVRLQRSALQGDVEGYLRETPDGLAEARGHLEACIADLEAQHGVTRDNLIIGGFSQGAMLTTEVALHAEKPYAGLAILSGTLISSARWVAAAAQNGPKLHVLQSHGRADPILPFSTGEALRDLLVTSGAQVQWVPHPGGHEIPGVVLSALAAFAHARLDGTPGA